MAGAKRGTWIGATVFGAVVIVVASWFLAINPALSAAADVRTQAAQVTSQNEVLARKVDKLKADFAKLDQYKKDLATERVQIPTTAQLSDYLRQLDTIAKGRSVTVVSVAPGNPQAVVAKAAAGPAPAPAPTPTATAAGGAATSGTASTGAPSAAVPGVPDGFTSIPVTLTVLGTYDNTLGFLSDLQTATPRLFLVSGFTATGQQDAAASGGKPATRVGDQQLDITGSLYVLPDSAAAAAPTPTATPALPGAVPGKNPLNPVGGK